MGLKAFGGYSRKLDHGVKIVYLLQPEWWDYLDYLRRKKAGEDLPDISEGWKSQDHIERELDEAIEGLYKIQVNVKEIATLVGIGDQRVTDYVKSHKLQR